MKNRIIKILEDTIPDKEGWLTFDNAAEQINALIEKVIEERMPTEENIEFEAFEYIEAYACRTMAECNAFIAGSNWFRDCMKGEEK